MYGFPDDLFFRVPSFLSHLSIHEGGQNSFILNEISVRYFFDLNLCIISHENKNIIQCINIFGCGNKYIPGSIAFFGINFSQIRKPVKRNLNITFAQSVKFIDQVKRISSVDENLFVWNK